MELIRKSSPQQIPAHEQISKNVASAEGKAPYPNTPDPNTPHTSGIFNTVVLICLYDGFHTSNVNLLYIACAMVSPHIINILKDLFKSKR
jgi:hypothetical protein